MLDDKGLASFKAEVASGDIKLWVGRCLVWVRDSGEVLDDTFASLLIESLSISFFTNLKRRANMAFVEFEIGFTMNFSCEFSILGVW